MFEHETRMDRDDFVKGVFESRTDGRAGLMESYQETPLKWTNQVDEYCREGLAKVCDQE